MKTLLLSLALAVMTPACGGGDERTSSAEGDVAIAVAPLQQVQRGANTFNLSLQAHEPIEDANVEVTVWMPSMGHGAPLDPTVARLTDGSYRIDNVVFSMPGTWELRVRVTCPKGWGAQTFRYQVS